MFKNFSTSAEVIIFLAILAALAVCVNADSLGKYFGVMAYPDHRRRHGHPTPQLGGVSILFGFAVWAMGEFFRTSTFADPILLTITLTSVGVGLVGFVDDQREVSPSLRIALMLVFLGIAFALDPQLISPALRWYSFGNTPVPILVYLPLMGLTAIGLVNSVNMADGQNGLVGSMFVTWAGCLMLVSTGELQMMAAALFVLCAVFLAFNLCGKVFLGDCGSYGVTFAIGLMVTLTHAEGKLPLETVIVWFFIPVIDCLRLIVMRPIQGRAFFQGGRDHFHHRLIDSLGNNLSAVTYVSVVVISSVIVTFEPRFALVVLCGLCAFYFTFARLSENFQTEALKSEDGGRHLLNIVTISDRRRHDREQS